MVGLSQWRPRAKREMDASPPVSNLEAIFYSSLITREVRLSLGIQATLKGRPQVQR